MGKIYNFAEIKYGQVPRPDDFAVAKEIVLDGLSRLYRSGTIYGGKVFGSVARGTPNMRSDFDLLVVTKKYSGAYPLRDLFNMVREKTKVRVEPIVATREIAELGYHSVDEPLLEHISNMPNEGNTAGEDPTQFLKLTEIPPHLTYREYMTNKLRKFMEGFFAFSDDDKMRVLQRALEAPSNVGRRVLQADARFLPDDSKGTVKNAFRSAYDGTSLIEPFEFLLVGDGFYTQYLRLAVEGGVSRGEYEQTLDSLSEKCIPQALVWADEILVKFPSPLEGNLQSSEGHPLRFGKEIF